MYDILIIGGGGAALSAAIEAKLSGAKVILVTENYPTRSQTSMAQGGINAALANVKEDSIDLHIKDTMRSAKSLADERMVKRLCSLAPDTIEWLNSIGVPFSRLEDGKIAQRQMGGASSIRACYSQDYTGLKILHTLYDYALGLGVEFLNEHHLLNLCRCDDRVCGATFLDIRETKIKEILAKATILATGGYAGVYNNHTTNSYQSTGDGIVAAYNVGANLSNLEFIQFHPTALKGRGVLISESARGAGGKLINDRGEEFVDELSTRDEVALAIKKEIDSGREVFLDLRGVGEEFIDKNLPQERRLCKIFAGIDVVKEPIPISPAAHYTMGGVTVDENFQSSVDALYAVGECSNARVHGANRLGGNSLLEIVAFGRECAKSALNREINGTCRSNQLEIDKQMIEDIFQKEPTISFYKKQDELSKSLFSDLGIVRDEKGLKAILSFTDDLESNLSLMGINDRSRVYNSNLLDFLKFKNSLKLSNLIAKLALDREESRGAHKRFDFPDIDPRWDKESIISKEIS